MKTRSGKEINGEIRLKKPLAASEKWKARRAAKKVKSVLAELAAKKTCPSDPMIKKTATTGISILEAIRMGVPLKSVPERKDFDSQTSEGGSVAGNLMLQGFNKLFNNQVDSKISDRDDDPEWQV